MGYIVSISIAVVGAVGVYYDFHRRSRFNKSVAATDPIVRWVANVMVVSKGTASEQRRRQKDLETYMTSVKGKKDFIDFALYASDDIVSAFHEFFHPLQTSDKPRSAEEMIVPLARFLASTRRQFYKRTNIREIQILEMLGITNVRQVWRGEDAEGGKRGATPQ